MSSLRPRRPAQLEPEQVEEIEGGLDPAYHSELANTSAHAIVALPQSPFANDDAVNARVLALLEDEGVDVLAETWADAPAESLPGILWRGYLLREWIRREREDVSDRFQTVVLLAQADGETARVEATPTPAVIRAEWDEVFKGAYEGDFEAVLRGSARFTDFLGRVSPVWIDDDAHPLATVVTLRDAALMATSAEFRAAAEAVARGTLS